MNLFFLFVFGCYFLMMLGLIIGWQETLISKPPLDLPGRFQKRLSVIVPFRNEQNNITNLIADLIQQDCSDEFEIILVDDHSQDQSVVRAREGIEGRTNFRVLTLPLDWEGKKHALDFGIENSKGDIIVTTDADCHLPINWLTAISSRFDDSKWMMVFGGVRLSDDRGFFSKLQGLEFCSIIGTGASTASLGFPTMCNGANLSFRRSAFEEVDGYTGNFEIPSGDDEFLMRKINQAFPGSVSFLPDETAVVETFPMNHRDEFIEQRLRWAGKWPYNSSRISQGLAVFIVLFQASFLAIWLAPLFNAIDWRFGLALVVFKIAFDFVFLYQVSSFLNTKWEAIHFLALQFVYPIYVIYIGLASLFRSYAWKGRRNKTKGAKGIVR